MTTTTSTIEPERCVQQVNWLQFDGFFVGVYEFDGLDPVSTIAVRLARDIEVLDESCPIPIGGVRTQTQEFNGRVGVRGMDVFFKEDAPQLLRAAIGCFDGPIDATDRILELIEKLVWMFIDSTTTRSEVMEIIDELHALKVRDIEWLR